MDAIKNPFSPDAGSPPPELVGREAILDQSRVLLGRIKATTEQFVGRGFSYRLIPGSVGQVRLIAT